MDKVFSYDDVVFRIGHYRNKNNLSARELSQTLGYGDAEINRIERKAVQLKVKTLLEIMECFNISPIEFFYSTPEDYEKDKMLVDLIKSLSEENRNVICDIAKRLK